MGAWRGMRGLKAIKCSNFNCSVRCFEMHLHLCEFWGPGWMAFLHFTSSDGGAFNMHNPFYILPVNSKIHDGSRTTKNQTKQNKIP